MDFENLKKQYVANIKIITSGLNKINVDQIYELTFTKKLIEELDALLSKQIKQTKTNDINDINEPEWIICDRENANKLKFFIQTETNSTIYMMRAIVNSVINVDKSEQINFEINGTLIGEWEKDSSNIKIIFSPKLINNTKLIMGFGPSASGKTISAKNVINLFKLVDKNFPTSFFTIDGGIYRDISYVYKKIVEKIKENGYGGFLNLMSKIKIEGNEDNISIFEPSIIKKKMVDYFIKKNINISLYIPETLGDCTKETCRSKYDKYIQISKDDKWNALLIWQHKYGGYIDCTFNDKYKCVGCITSGKKREINEGKKYNDNSWQTAYDNGVSEMLTAPGYKLKIHNSGTAEKISIIEDYTTEKTNIHMYIGKQYIYINKNQKINQTAGTLIKKYKKYKEKYFLLKNQL